MTNTLVWLRNDLRMKDNPLFDYVIKNKRRILPVFVIDSNNNLGPSSKWWLYKSIKSLSNSMNNNLLVLDGETEVIIKQLIKDYRIEEILWGRRYNPEDVAIDRDIQKFAKNQSVEVKIFETSLLTNPSEILKKDGHLLEFILTFTNRNIKILSLSRWYITIIKYNFCLLINRIP